jgi:single-strand DNA-binding protein
MYQSLTLVGNLGSDPELRYVQSGEAVTNFSLAVNRVWNKDGEKQSETTWFRISVWGKQAEATNQYLSKGRQVLVEGRLRPDPATGGPATFKRQDGSIGASFEVWANTVRFLQGSGENGGQPASGQHKASVSGPAASKEDEEIPF